MRLKYLLRGFGIGMVFTALILFTAYREAGTSQMTDREVMERAQELGMVMEDTEPSETEQTSDEVTTSDESQTATGQETGVTGEEQTTGQETGTTDEAQTTEADKTEEQTTESSTQVSVTVSRGMASYTVCEQLAQLGVIADAAEFDNYLIENGYATRIRVGTHTLTPGMDYHSIAEAISDPIS